MSPNNGLQKEASRKGSAAKAGNAPNMLFYGVHVGSQIAFCKVAAATSLIKAKAPRAHAW